MPSILFIPPQTRAVSTFSVVPAHGARVYDPPPGGSLPSDPNDVYMLYVGINQGAEVRMQLMARRGAGSADATAQMLCSMARVGDPQYVVGYNFTGIIWYAPCNLYIVMDKPNCDFINNRPVEDFDPLHFHETKPLLMGAGSLHFDQNRSFYDGQILNNAIVGAPAFRCTNYFTSEYGDLIRHPQLRTYGFEIRYRTPGGLDVIDPDGQNQGPP